MPEKSQPESLVVSPGPSERTVISEGRKVLQVPGAWDLLPPGDAGLTRRVKASGPTWTVKEKKGRRTFSRGVWADRRQIAAAKEKLEAERSTESYAKKQKSAALRREKQQNAYVEDFQGAVRNFLRFDPVHAQLEQTLASAITKHATPVGSGTVARTKTIPIEQRAESAVIAWMRHQTTAYDNMKIARVRGRRREVRRELAARSRELLGRYRQPQKSPPRSNCPLQAALKSLKNAD